MKTDWSQMAGFWVGMDEREPPSPGEYFVTTTHFRDHNMKWDGNRWDLKRLDDWVVYWYDTITDANTGLSKETKAI